jgi:myo-inositol-1(or 4)-monophosphatase
MSGQSGQEDPFLTTAAAAVRLAGAIQLNHLQSDIQVARKGKMDIVTNVDLEVETMVRQLIRARFPEHGVLAEETAETAPFADSVRHRWLFDPLDGTVNYAHGVPFFCSSIALEVGGLVEVGAVYDPSRNDLFSARRGQGASLNGRRVVVSDAGQLSDVVLGTGFPHNATMRDPAMERLLGECAIRARGLRRLGSAALDLCYVACGRTAGFWDKNLKPWDTAAGALIVEEAGGRVTALDGSAFDPYAGDVLAGNGRIHEAILAIVHGRPGKTLNSEL